MNEPAVPTGDGGLVRVRLDLAYDGGPFHGWAAQPGLDTVENELGGALARVLRLPSSPALVVAGRTDAGVHATGQVCHADLPSRAWQGAGPHGGREPGVVLRDRLNGLLPASVRVLSASAAPDGFDARFSALRRCYAYLVCDDPAGVPPLRRHDVVGHRGILDVDDMDAAARSLEGLHDFGAYCRARDRATTVRTLLRFRCSRDADALVVADVQADAFCHSMVRALVGALLAVGSGRRPVTWPAAVLAAGRRDPAVTVAPARGLVLREVCYPAPEELAARAAQSRARRSDF